MNQFREIANRFKQQRKREESYSRKTFRYNFSGIDELLLVPFGDQHIGDRDFNEGLFCDTLDYIYKADRKNRPCRILLMGDYINNYGRKSPGIGFFESVMMPEQQTDYFRAMIKPVAHLVLAALEGNHDRWSGRDTGQFWLKDMCKSLDIPYCRYGAELSIKVNGNRYTIMAKHGKSSATTKEGKRRVLRRLVERCNADLVLMAHVHDKIIEQYHVLDVGRRGQKKRLGVVTGHGLNYGGYAEEATLEPGESGVVKVKLFGDRWDMHAST